MIKDIINDGISQIWCDEYSKYYTEIVEENCNR